MGKRGKGTIEVTEQDNEIFLVTMRTVNAILVNTQLQGVKVTETQSCLSSSFYLGKSIGKDYR